VYRVADSTARHRRLDMSRARPSGPRWQTRVLLAGSGTGSTRKADAAAMWEHQSGGPIVPGCRSRLPQGANLTLEHLQGLGRNGSGKGRVPQDADVIAEFSQVT